MMLGGMWCGICCRTLDLTWICVGEFVVQQIPNKSKQVEFEPCTAAMQITLLRLVGQVYSAVVKCADVAATFLKHRQTFQFTRLQRLLRH